MSSVAAMRKTETVVLPITDLKQTFFVRKQLDEDRVLYFMELYEAGAKVPPIEVVRGTMEIKDGRHRKAALEHLNRERVECLLVEPKERKALIIEAFGANFGGALPPTRLDILHVMKQLIMEGSSLAQLKKDFSAYYPPSVVTKYVRDAANELATAKLSRAVQAVTHGDKTVTEAATEHDVNEDQLRDKISGVKRKRRTAKMADLKSQLSRRYGGNTRRTAAEIRSLLSRFEDGELDAAKVEEVFRHLERTIKRGLKTLLQWRERFVALKGTTKAKA